jgi:hypothetical protein
MNETSIRPLIYEFCKNKPTSVRAPKHYWNPSGTGTLLAL